MNLFYYTYVIDLSHTSETVKEGKHCIFIYSNNAVEWAMRNISGLCLVSGFCSLLSS